MQTTTEHRFMSQALRLAEQGLGEVWPNPAVGCVIVKENRVIGLGRTQKGGRPHAETEALAMAGEAAHGAALYVTLEPCAHQGNTPPCTEAIITAGIAEVIIACGDPDNRVNGQGMQQLKDAGLKVSEGVCQGEARELNKGFFSRIQRQRPWVSMKIATSADGFIADANGKSKWITGELARRHGHWLRSRHDAILTGIGTVLADDPALTCRLPGLEDRSPQRIVLDRQGRMPKTAQMLKDGKGEVWIFDKSYPDLNIVLAELAERGITRLLVEAGGGVSSAFLNAGLVDELYWYRAPTLFGTGLAAFDKLEQPFKGKIIKESQWGADSLTLYRFPC